MNKLLTPFHPTKVLETLRNFFFAEVSPLPLAALRIGIATIIILQSLLITGDIYQYYGQGGFIQKDLLEYFSSNFPFAPRISTFAQLLGPYGMDYKSCVLMIYSFFLTSVFFVLIGWWTRFFAFCAWLGHFVLLNSAPTIIYGVDNIHHIMLFYFILFPVSETLSVDSALSNSPPAPAGSLTSFTRTLALRLVQFHICLIYFQSGTAKTEGEGWWNGEAVWRSFMSPEYRQYDFSWLAHFPTLALMGSLGTLVIEIFYPFFIWHPRTRNIWLGLTLMLHAGIALFQGLWMFSATMVVLNVSAFYLEKQSLTFPRKFFLKKALTS